MVLRVRSTRRTRLLLAAIPVVGISVGGAEEVLLLVREFNWFGAVLLVACVVAVTMGWTIFRIQLRTERRMTAGMVEKYRLLRQFLAEHGEDRLLIAREANVVILPATEWPMGFARFDRDELADAVERRDPAAIVVGERFHLDDQQPMVTHRVLALAPFSTDSSAVPALTQHTTSTRTPRAWWRSWQLLRSISRTGIDVPSEHELDELIDQIRSAA
ncbi:hypothetical protein [Amycolatopsis sp. NPDC051903]|uniref:hypothetical protein n=1 Tax=Amycolatopsis sp. NPDC051903 TaxID=3363936 RepID=UPI0037AC730B